MISNTFPGRPSCRAATYAQRIKNKTRNATKSPARSAAKAKPAAVPKSEPTAKPPTASGELERLKDELQRVNQDISRLARAARPGAEHSQLPEKQELLGRKIDLERKIRAHPKT